MSAKPYPKFSAWLVGSVTISPLSWGVVFLPVLPCLLRMPLRELVAPYVTVCIAWVLLSPLFYLSRKHWVQSGGDTRPMALTVGAAFMVIGGIGVYFGIRLGLLLPEQAHVYYGVVVAVMLVATIGGYYGHRLIFRRRKAFR